MPRMVRVPYRTPGARAVAGRMALNGLVAWILVLPLVVAKATLWLKPMNTQVRKGQVSTLPTGNTCPLEIAPNMGSQLYNGDTFPGILNTQFLRCGYGASNTSPAGTYTIVASGVSAANYDLKWKPGTLTVTP